MNQVKIKITGPGNSFGAITRVIEALLVECGANVEVIVDHDSAIMSIEEATNYHHQVKDRHIVIETESLPWGG